MNRTIISAVLLAISATTLSVPAFAVPARVDLSFSGTSMIQTVHHRDRRFSRHQGEHRVLPPRRIARKLYRRGYRDIQNIRFRRGEYRVRALGYRGPVKLIVNAYTGEVIFRQRIRKNQRNYHNRGRTFGGRHGGFSWSYSIR